MMRIYYGIMDILSPSIHFLFGIKNKVLPRLRVRIMALDKDGNLLLVRGASSRGAWSLPGGGVDNHEAPRQAAMRELFEETGISLDDGALRYRCTQRSDNHFDAHFYEVFLPHAITARVVRPYEIRDVQWHDIQSLPPDITTFTLRGLRKSGIKYKSLLK